MSENRLKVAGDCLKRKSMISVDLIERTQSRLKSINRIDSVTDSKKEILIPYKLHIDDESRYGYLPVK